MPRAQPKTSGAFAAHLSLTCGLGVICLYLLARGCQLQRLPLGLPAGDSLQMGSRGGTGSMPLITALAAQSALVSESGRQGVKDLPATVVAVLVHADNRLKPESSLCPEIPPERKEYSRSSQMKYGLLGAALNKRWLSQFPDHRLFFAVGDGLPVLAPDARTPLKGSWAKVKASREAMRQFPTARYFVYADTDAVISARYWNNSIPDLFELVRQNYGSDGKIAPFVVTQEPLGWWCKHVRQYQPTYTACLNDGAFMWENTPANADLLDHWWEASLDNYSIAHQGRYWWPFRTEWPFEQDRLMALVNDVTHPLSLHVKDRFRVIPDPENLSMDITWDQMLKQGRSYASINRRGRNFCFAAATQAGCFLNHNCFANFNRQQGFRQAAKRLGLEHWTGCASAEDDPFALRPHMHAVLARQ
eukprot:TRINITY_DN18029_c2_g1_i1.p1 TRINITY_DN18029_c2_g1~~TRINITY_DN18029_c2_g1_i1.p1  ORF type:complete len:417 (+),score=30.47 TRINITY_DN18029_c2_g1_i1:105-1355(+)